MNFLVFFVVLLLREDYCFSYSWLSRYLDLYIKGKKKPSTEDVTTLLCLFDLKPVTGIDLVQAELSWGTKEVPDLPLAPAPARRVENPNQYSIFLFPSLKTSFVNSHQCKKPNQTQSCDRMLLRSVPTRWVTCYHNWPPMPSLRLSWCLASGFKAAVTPVSLVL